MSNEKETKNQKFYEEIHNKIRAGFPAFSVRTLEEANTITDLISAFSTVEVKGKVIEFKKFAEVSHLKNWRIYNGDTYLNKVYTQRQRTPIEEYLDIERDQNRVFVLIDCLDDTLNRNTAKVRAVKEAILNVSSAKSCVIFVDSNPKIPVSLEQLVTPVDYDLLNEEQIEERIETARKSALASKKDVDDYDTEKVVRALSGMTSTDIENSLYLSVIKNSTFDPEFISDEKVKAIKKTGLLEILSQKEDISNLGGFVGIKEYLKDRKNSFSKAAKEFGIEEAKGFLTIGVPGSGKSLLAKIVGSYFQIPTIKLDMAKLESSLVGSSNANLRKAIRTIEAMAPCVVWMDEIEKALAGSSTQSSGDTSGVAQKQLGTLLTWLQDNEKPVFVIGTANSTKGLDAALLRSGRFDDLFFVDVPNAKERTEIFKIHIEKKRRAEQVKTRSVEDFDVERLVKNSKGYSGAEIEGLVKEALTYAFNDDMREPTTDDILKAISRKRPQTETCPDEIKEIQEWGKKNNIRKASQTELEFVKTSTKGRTIV